MRDRWSREGAHVRRQAGRTRCRATIRCGPRRGDRRDGRSERQHDRMPCESVERGREHVPNRHHHARGGARGLRRGDVERHMRSHRGVGRLGHAVAGGQHGDVVTGVHARLCGDGLAGAVAAARRARSRQLDRRPATVGDAQQNRRRGRRAARQIQHDRRDREPAPHGHRAECISLVEEIIVADRPSPGCAGHRCLRRCDPCLDVCVAAVLDGS